MIPISEWLPDQPDLANPGATIAKNVLPFERSYGPLNSSAVFSDALDAYARGAISVVDASGDVHNIAGDAAKLYSLTNDTWNALGTGYTSAATDMWEFVKFNEKVIATNGTDRPQVHTLGTPGAGTFANLHDLFDAKHVAVIGDFVVFGNVNDGANVPNQVRWSALGDETDYTASATTQAGSANLRNGVQVQRITSGSFGLVFCETSLYRMSYVNSPDIWDFDEIDPGLAFHTPGSVVQVGIYTFFLADDGFRVSSGGPSERIGVGKVNRTIWAELDQDNLHRISAAVDPKNALVFWAVPTTGNTGGRPNKLYIYNYKVDRWAFAEIQTELVYPSGTQGFTLEQLDNINASLDALPESLDSPAYTGGNLELALFDSDHKLAYFSGDPLTAVVETAEFQPSPGRKTSLRGLRALVDGGTTTIQIGTRDAQSAAYSFSDAQSQRTGGRFSVRANARYLRARLNVSGLFTHIHGLDDIEATRTSRR